LRQTAEDALLTGEIAPAGLSPIVVVGPTASGKTELALALARALDGEVVSADSRQIYRELCAGTAKPVRDRQGRVEGVFYHLVDCVPVTEPFDAGRFAALARARVAEARRQGRVSIVAGGTGLYVRALLEGLCALPPRDEALRRRLEEEARAHGRDSLHERLARADPEAAAAIPPNNIRRVVRALEVYELTGRPISEIWREDKKTRLGGRIIPSAILRIDWPPEILRRRIAARAGLMWPRMLEEVRELLRRFNGEEPGFQSLGYPEAVACAQGRLSPDEGLARLVNSTCAYARRQRTWFRHQLSACGIGGSVGAGGTDFHTAGAQAVAGGRLEDMLGQALQFIPDHTSP
jgi:tRNA dimethylallyltransferase